MLPKLESHPFKRKNQVEDNAIDVEIEVAFEVEKVFIMYVKN